MFFKTGTVDRNHYPIHVVVIKNVLLFFVFSSAIVCGQSALPEHGTMSKSGYVEYLPGNIPIIISVPHDGEKGPDFIVDRAGGDIHTKADRYTQEMGFAIRKAFFEMTGKIPFVIVNHMKRKKVDVNREVDEAAMGNQVAESVWDDYHSYIDSAKEQVYSEFKKGLYIDLHAHDHTAQFLELGYLLDAEELALEDADLNDEMFIEKSSIRNLIASSGNTLKFADVVRGKYSLGAMFDESGYPAVPSKEHPAPGLQSFFRGGYSLNRHGSASGGTIDGIQIETNYDDVRSSSVNINKFAHTFVKIMSQYMDRYYAFHIPQKVSSEEQSPK